MSVLYLVWMGCERSSWMFSFVLDAFCILKGFPSFLSLCCSIVWGCACVVVAVSVCAEICICMHVCVRVYRIPLSSRKPIHTDRLVVVSHLIQSHLISSHLISSHLISSHLTCVLYSLFSSIVTFVYPSVSLGTNSTRS